MHMKKKILTVFALVLICLGAVAAFAGDFCWMGEFNKQAEADPAGFKQGLADRFNIKGDQVKSVLDTVEAPADAYTVLRLGEISSQSTESVLKKYQTEKDRGKGWGALAQSLGIKPGSEEFHELKRGDDLKRKSDGDEVSKGKGREKSKGKPRGKK